MIHRMIDNTIDLTAITRRAAHDTARIRLSLQKKGLTWIDANRFAHYAVYGSTLPNGRTTLTKRQRARITSLDILVTN